MHGGRGGEDIQCSVDDNVVAITVLRHHLAVLQYDQTVQPARVKPC